MLYVKQFFSSLSVLSTLLFITGLVLLYIKIFDVNVKDTAYKTSRKFIVSRIKKDRMITRRQEQMERIGRGATGWRKTYRDLVQNIIISLKLTGVSVQNFTSIFMFIGFLIWVGCSFIFSSLLLGAFIAVPAVFAIIAGLVSFTKASRRSNDNRVMDSLDLICPTIDASVVSAIKENMDGFDIRIRRHYQRFLDDMEAHGLLFKEAIVELNKRLGPRFDDFAQKAIIFHETGDEGMNEMFMDVPEMNNIIRSINRKTDLVFNEKNVQMLACDALVVGFLMFAYNNSLTGDIMRDTFIGRAVSAVSIAIMIMVYAIFQVAQATLNYDEVKKEK